MADICDFCSSPRVVRRYDCIDFPSESLAVGVLHPNPITGEPTNVVLNSRNYWAACALCAYFVEREDLEGLFDRAIKRHRKQGYEIGIPMQKHIRRTYELFFKYRIRVTNAPVV